MKCTKGLLRLGANIHQRFLAMLKIEKLVALQKLSLTRIEMPLYKSFGLLPKFAQGIKRFDIVRVGPAAERHHRGVIAPCRYPFLHGLRKP